MLLTGKPLHYEAYIPGTRKKRWGIISKVPILNAEGKTSGVLGYFTDITKRKETESLLVKLKEALDMLDEAIWIAEGAKQMPTGEVRFENFLYVINNKLKKRIVGSDTEMSMLEFQKRCFDIMVDNENRKKANLDYLKKTGSTIAAFDLKLPETNEIVSLKNNIHCNPKKDLYIGVVSENKDRKIIEKTVNEFRKCGVSEEIIQKVMKNL